ncbi:hypothetical protein HID58_023178 [Brassica napus]|uniref:FAZ1 C-terminal region domain-containing protein n=1 Tax=Brassica napus TaxID=3708 RepID=A0ABQ8D1C0_BRANA|nr:hypothetical protein HID58_023178 [Brassica napus]
MISEPEKMISQPEKMISEPEKMISEPEKMISEPKKMTSEPEKMIPEPETTIPESETTVPDTQLMSRVSGILKSCVVGIPPFTRLSGLESRCLLSLSTPRSATTLFISKVYRFGSLLWVSEKICWVSTACSGEHPSIPFDVPVSSPPISTFGVSPRYSPSLIKRMVVYNPRSFKISDGFIRVFVMRLLLPLFYEDCFGGYTVFAYGFNLFLYREEYFATMPPLYERRCFLGSITEALLQFIHQFVILWSGL